VIELIRQGAEILVTAGSSASSAAKHQTSTIPIVFINVGNPIGIGLVKSLNHPGGNVTGFTDAIADLSGKFVDLARELGGQQAPIDYLWHTAWEDGPNRLALTEKKDANCPALRGTVARPEARYADQSLARWSGCYRLSIRRKRD
jgi:putative ABC transport system substrate-binding protein